MVEDKKPIPPGANIWFTGLYEPNQGKHYRVEATPAYIGSGESNDIRLDSPGVSESHARITMAGSEFYLEDLGTGGETKVNTMTVERTRLQNGDLIELGETRLLLQLYLEDLKSTSSQGVTEPETISIGNNNGEVWAAGFTSGFRDWFSGEMASKLKITTRSFRTGDEVLTELNKTLAEGAPPSLLILDLRLSIINGINVALATRAFELGFKEKEKIPIVFMFSPPKQASFDKVVKFCQPLRVVAPGEGEEELKITARKVLKGARL